MNPCRPTVGERVLALVVKTPCFAHLEILGSPRNQQLRSFVRDDWDMNSDKILPHRADVTMRMRKALSLYGEQIGVGRVPERAFARGQPCHIGKLDQPRAVDRVAGRQGEGIAAVSPSQKDAPGGGMDRAIELGPCRAW